MSDRERVDGCLEKIAALVKERDAWQTIAKNLTELLDEAEAQYAELPERIALHLEAKADGIPGSVLAPAYRDAARSVCHIFAPTTIPDQETPAP